MLLESSDAFYCTAYYEDDVLVTNISSSAIQRQTCVSIDVVLSVIVRKRAGGREGGGKEGGREGKEGGRREEERGRERGEERKGRKENRSYSKLYYCLFLVIKVLFCSIHICEWLMVSPYTDMWLS